MNIDRSLKVNRVTGSITEWYYQPVAAHTYRVARVEQVNGEWLAIDLRGNKVVSRGADHKSIEAAAAAVAEAAADGLIAYCFTAGIVGIDELTAELSSKGF